MNSRPDPYTDIVHKMSALFPEGHKFVQILPL